MLNADAGCPRCGRMFHCGATDPAPCECTTIALDAATLAALRHRYAGCLCLACLRELGMPTSAPDTTPAGRL